MMIKRICPGWSTHIGVPKEMGRKPNPGPDVITHGICEDCYEAMMATVPLPQPAISENLVAQLQDVL